MRLGDVINKPEKMKQYKKKATRLCIAEEGMTPDLSLRFNRLMREYLCDATNIFSEEILNSCIGVIYVFDPIINDTKSDGVMTRKYNETTDETVQAIGIGTVALERGRLYTIFVFLHELTHLHGFERHDILFRIYLDSLRQRYREATGVNIPNYDEMN